MKKLALFLISVVLLSGCATSLKIKDHKASFLFDNAGTNTSNIASIVSKYYGDLEPFRKKTIDGGC